ncbi:MAG: flagellar basal body rod C-terminal domain-containing protein [Candidatus Gastranaerophilales bacterium]|nr:flagellar basal body rod C-terminal domain-containing protein [Candidatus Gastranaerophilales bacterium]
MNDSFITALNVQKATVNWMDVLAENMGNTYTPGFRENSVNFQTFLGGAILDNPNKKLSQGKSMPGTSNSNLFLEGQGYFVVKNQEGKSIYTRLGEFTFDKEGVYKNKDGHTVQGYILNDKGEIMQGTSTVNADLYQETTAVGGAMNIPTTNIKLWIDPNNGKYLGKYDDYEIKGDGILYGKADKGKTMVPLYKIANMNFHNSAGLYEIKQGLYIETEESGNPVMGRGEIRSGLLEMSNVDFKGNISYFQQAKVQMELTNKLISTNKQLLEETLKLVGS